MGSVLTLVFNFVTMYCVVGSCTFILKGQSRNLGFKRFLFYCFFWPYVIFNEDDYDDDDFIF